MTKQWYHRREVLLDSKLRLRVGHIQVMRMQHERFGHTAKFIAKHYKKNYRWNYRFIQSILDYKLWPQVKALGGEDGR